MAVTGKTVKLEQDPRQEAIDGLDYVSQQLSTLVTMWNAHRRTLLREVEIAKDSHNLAVVNQAYGKLQEFQAASDILIACGLIRERE